MATSVQTRDVVWCDGVPVDGQDFRLAQLSALLTALGGAAGSQLGVQGGVRDSTGAPLQVSVATGLSVTVNPGFAHVPGTSAANAGVYSVTVDTAATLTCQTADTVNPRIDVVCVTVTDNGDSSSNAVTQVVTGTPAPVPAVPALPANSVALAQVEVPANATSLSAGDVTDVRMFSAATGAIMPVLNASLYPTVGGSAMYLHNIATGRLVRMSSSGAIVAPSTALFAPVTDTGSATATSTTYQTITSASVTTDGDTMVKVTLTFESITASSNSAGDYCLVRLLRDGSDISHFAKVACTAGAHIDGGQLMVPDTPAAGTHTYTWQIAANAAGTFALHVGAMLIEAISP